MHYRARVRMHGIVVCIYIWRGLLECRRTLALLSGGGWWNEDAMEWKDREVRTPETECIGMEEATARLSGFILTECLEEVARGKGVTEWNEQNWLAAWSGLSRCIKGRYFLYLFTTQKIERVMHLPSHEKHYMAFCEMKWGNTLALGAEGAAGISWRQRPQGTQNVGEHHFIKMMLWLGYLT